MEGNEGHEDEARDAGLPYGVLETARGICGAGGTHIAEVLSRFADMLLNVSGNLCGRVLMIETQGGKDK